MEATVGRCEATEEAVAARLNADGPCLCAVLDLDDFKRIKRLQLNVRSLGEVLPGPGKVSTSIGAVIVSTGVPFQALYRRADAALYDAKTHGKDSCALGVWVHGQDEGHAVSPDPPLHPF